MLLRLFGVAGSKLEKYMCVWDRIIAAMRYFDEMMQEKSEPGNHRVVRQANV